MKIKLLFVLLFISTTIFAQIPEVSLYDIQYQHPDSLTTVGDRPSPYLGDTVTVIGIVMNPSFTNGTATLISGAPAVYIQDTSITEYGGLLVRFPNGSSSAFDAIDSGTVAKFTGVVTEFNVTTQFDLIEFDGSTIIDFKPRPQPVVIPLDSLSVFGSLEGQILAEKWEGVLVEVRNVTVGSNSIGQGSFSVFDANNTEVMIGNQSAYWRNTPPPQAGTVLNYVRGYIQNRINFGGFQNLMIIMPVYPEDVEVAQFPPNISDVSRDPAIVGFGQPVTITATIEDPDGTVANAMLNYNINSSTSGSVAMTNSSGDTWTATLPAQNDSSVVDFYITAEDNQGNVSTNPSDTTRNKYFYLVLNRPLTVQDVQFSPFGSGFSGYNGYEVTVTGVVTADTTDIQGDGASTGIQVFIQNGTGPWSAIRINGTEVLNRVRGDNVTVTGTVGESFSITLISGIDSPSNITVNSSGNALPEPEVLPTSTFSGKANGAPEAEQWEGVLIRFDNLIVTDENADGNPGPDEGSGGNRNFGELIVDDNSGGMRVELQDGTHQYHNFWEASLETQPIRILTDDQLDELHGIQWFSFGNYKLIPRKNDDFVNLTDVGNMFETPVQYSLEQNYPNPFNPSTIISYNIPREGFVTLIVYNLLGQLVKTLVNEHQSPGNYNINFDASNLPSGIYFYGITAGDFSSVKKMILIK